jgi:hypothetical protein
MDFGRTLRAHGPAVAIACVFALCVVVSVSTGNRTLLAVSIGVLVVSLVAYFAFSSTTAKASGQGQDLGQGQGEGRRHDDEQGQGQGEGQGQDMCSDEGTCAHDHGGASGVRCALAQPGMGTQGPDATVTGPSAWSHGPSVPTHEQSETASEQSETARGLGSRPKLVPVKVDDVRGVLQKEQRRIQAAVRASAPDPARLAHDRQLRKKKGTTRRRQNVPAKDVVQDNRPDWAPGDKPDWATDEPQERRFMFPGARPNARATLAARAPPMQDPSKTPSENAAARMMYRGMKMPEPLSARQGLVQGMMRDFPFRPARGMVLVEEPRTIRRTHA